MSTTDAFRKTVTVRSVTYARTSKNGNPTYRIVTDEGVFDTQTDASLGYGITNYTNSSFPETYIIDQQVTLVMTKTQRVWGIEKDGKPLR